MSGDFWTGRRVLVTGATGLLGSWLARALLERGARVAALVAEWDPRSELARSGAAARCARVTAPVEDAAAVERAVREHAPEAVFHLAARALVEEAARAPLAALETNVRGTANVLEACRLHAATVRRVVVASSDKAYGPSAVLPYTEDMPLAGRAPYDVSKACADLIARMYHAAYGLPVAVARCGNLFGGGDLHWSRLVPGTIRSLWRDQRPVVRSDGAFRRDYVYVRDAVEGYLALAEALDRPGVAGEAFNFGPGEPRAVLEVVARLGALMGKPALEPIVLDEARGEIREQSLSAAKARRVLGWAPRHAFDDALRETIGWYERALPELA